MGVVMPATLQDMWTNLRRLIIGATGLVVVLFAVFVAASTWKATASRDYQMETDGVHVVPHLLRNTYTGGSRFEASCDEIGNCQAAGERICGKDLTILQETQDPEGFWLLLAECNAGRTPEW